MQISYFSICAILLAGILPFIWTGYAKITSQKYNNSTTRDSSDKFTGESKRAHFAHLNSFEALPLFVGSVIIAHINQVPLFTLHSLTAIYLTLRILYGFLYIYNLATLRSTVWTLALFCNLGLLILSLP